MRTWILARRPLPCGGCTARIGLHTPLLEIRTSAGLRFARCPVCAKSMGEEPPTDMLEQERVAPQPSLGVPRVPRRPEFVTPRGFAQRFAQDVKARQIAREPGEDG